MGTGTNGTKQADKASATTKGPMRTAAEMVETGKETLAALNASSQTANDADVKANVGFWQTENDNLDANNKKKTDLKAQLLKVDADEVTLMRRWGLRRAGVLHAVNVSSDGSVEKIQAFNLPVLTRSSTPIATTPEDLRQVKSQKPTTVVIEWTRVKGNDGYMVQWATDPNNSASWSRPSMCKRRRFSLPGQALGTTLHFRVLALDARIPGGQTEYCAWVPTTVGL